MSLRQKTLCKSISISGKGLHSGKNVKVILNPSPTDHGITFRRVDVLRSPLIKAHVSNVVDTTLATTLGVDGVNIATVEHLLSALVGFQIDNVHIDVDGPEIPILDGSSRAFVEALSTVGSREQKSLKNFLVITKPVAVRQKDRFSYLFPSDEFKVTCRIEFPHKAIGKQRFEMSFPFITAYRDSKNARVHKNGNGNGNGNGHSQGIFSTSELYAREIGGARTFGFVEEVAYLQKKGLALGGGLDNAVVLDKNKIINEEPLRWDNEFVRHKVLDSLGDVSLLGYQVLGHLVTYRSGHGLHRELVEKTLKSTDSWKIMTFDNISSSREDFLLSRTFDHSLLQEAIL